MNMQAVAELLLTIEAHIDSRVRREMAASRYLGAYPGTAALMQWHNEKQAAQEACDQTQRNLHTALMKALIPEGR